MTTEDAEEGRAGSGEVSRRDAEAQSFLKVDAFETQGEALMANGKTPQILRVSRSRWLDRPAWKGGELGGLGPD